MKTKQFFTALLLLTTGTALTQQLPDTAFTYQNVAPRYAHGKGPMVWLDEAHFNFHTLGGRYASFGKVVQADGYRIAPNQQEFTPASLANCDILVIANALDSVSNTRWVLPNHSAFSPAEITAVQNWVQQGGRLFLIADHMPFAGSAADLAAAFGIRMLNCFAMDNRRRFPEKFFRAEKTLLDSPLTVGIDTVVTFTGSAFQLPEKGKAVLTLKNYTLLMPAVAWQFDETTPYRESLGWHQLGYLPYGKGKVVISGEAAMFSAQLAGANQMPVGMNQPEARQNPQLLLQIMAWLSEP
ncbi:MAG: DUF4350 domain-containing protein [Saprospiraceae bacterium]|nr:hypothetical protein [Lewinellaceae bacterium]